MASIRKHEYRMGDKGISIDVRDANGAVEPWQSISEKKLCDVSEYSPPLQRTHD